uniref:SCP domain-containing protein n=1 Tax=Trichobilharzia regenti TaxID=157069 RepID=A0AA85JMG1_TRIRE|nr:unnamed protein product [Trichobilharzia regenti]
MNTEDGLQATPRHRKRHKGRKEKKKSKDNTENIPTTSELYEFNLICLEENNRLRSLHNCPPLKLSRKLMKSALQHSEFLRQQRQLQQVADIKCGQNLALIIGQTDYKVAGLNAIQAWYKQSENYDYKEHFQLNRGYFTQMIWKTTREVGFAFSIPEQGNFVFVVGHYLPAGNKNEEYIENVPSKIEEGDQTDSIKPDRSIPTNKENYSHSPRCPTGQCVII